jgi:hypothetical protein
MRISALEIKNFGPIGELSLKIPPAGIQIVTGNNGSGKTNVIAAAYFALFGDILKAYRAGDGQAEDTEVTVILEDGDNTELNYLSATSKGISRKKPGEISDGSQFPLRDKLLKIISNPLMPRLVFSPNKTPAGYTTFAAEAFALLEDLAETAPSGKAWREFRNRLAHCRVDGEASATLLSLIDELARRISSGISIPLFIDDDFACISSDYSELIAEVLARIAETNQVILFSARGFTPNIGRVRCNLLLDLNRIPRVPDSHISRAGADGRSFMFHAAAKAAERKHGEADFQKTLARIEAKLDSVAKDVSEIKSMLIKLVAQVSQLAENYANDLEQAISESNQLLETRICSAISHEADRLLRKGIPVSRLEPFYGMLREEIGPDWGKLDPITQKNLALARYLAENSELACIHLSILEVCRSLEFAISKHIFAAFAESAGDKSYPEAPPSCINPKFRKTYDIFRKYLAGKASLSLGEFAWVMKAADESGGVELFGDFKQFFSLKYGETGDQIARLVKDLLFDSGGKLGLDRSITEIRNRCAHPPSIAGDNSQFSEQTFMKIWAHALKKPIELLMRITAK